MPDRVQCRFPVRSAHVTSTPSTSKIKIAGEIFLFLPRLALVHESVKKCVSKVCGPARNASNAQECHNGIQTQQGHLMPKYSGVDFIDFDSQLNDEEKLVRRPRANSSKTKSPSSKAKP